MSSSWLEEEEHLSLVEEEEEEGFTPQQDMPLRQDQLLQSQ
jgi:hypothetical protein